MVCVFRPSLLCPYVGCRLSDYQFKSSNCLFLTFFLVAVLLLWINPCGLKWCCLMTLRSNIQESTYHCLTGLIECIGYKMLRLAVLFFSSFLFVFSLNNNHMLVTLKLNNLPHDRRAFRLPVSSASPVYACAHVGTRESGDYSYWYFQIISSHNFPKQKPRSS